MEAPVFNIATKWPPQFQDGQSNWSGKKLYHNKIDKSNRGNGPMEGLGGWSPRRQCALRWSCNLCCSLRWVFWRGFAGQPWRPPREGRDGGMLLCRPQPQIQSWSRSLHRVGTGALLSTSAKSTTNFQHMQTAQPNMSASLLWYPLSNPLTFSETPSSSGDRLVAKVMAFSCDCGSRWYIILAPVGDSAWAQLRLGWRQGNTKLTSQKMRQGVGMVCQELVVQR